MRRIQSVKEYLSVLHEPARLAVKSVRAVLKTVLREADEMINYDLPTYKVDDRPVLYIGGWKAHLSLYPATRAVARELRRELRPYAVNKGTIRFPLSEPMPLDLIRRIAEIRLREALAAPIIDPFEEMEPPSRYNTPKPLQVVTLPRIKKKKAVAKKAVAKKAVAKKAVAKQAVAKQAVAKQAVARQAVAKQAVARQAVARQAVAKKAVAKQAVAKQAVAKQAVAKQAVPKQAPERSPLRRG